jgi:hypothetical protein
MILRRVITSSNQVNAAREVNFAEDTHEERTKRMYLDSCCSHGMVIVNDRAMEFLSNVVQQWNHDEISLTEEGKVMTISHIARLGPFDNVFVCPNSRKNICGLLRLADMGYMFEYGPNGKWLRDAATLVTVLPLLVDGDSGLPYLRITDFVMLTDRNSTGMRAIHMLDGVAIRPHQVPPQGIVYPQLRLHDHGFAEAVALHPIQGPNRTVPGTDDYMSDSFITHQPVLPEIRAMPQIIEDQRQAANAHNAGRWGPMTLFNAGVEQSSDDNYDTCTRGMNQLNEEGVQTYRTNAEMDAHEEAEQFEAGWQHDQDEDDQA